MSGQCKSLTESAEAWDWPMGTGYALRLKIRLWRTGTLFDQGFNSILRDSYFPIYNLREVKLWAYEIVESFDCRYLKKVCTMKTASEVVQTFYKAFQNKDFATMQQLYADGARFSDEVFVDLKAAEVRAMWEMLIRRGKDLELTFEILSSDEETCHARWIARYSFSKSGNRVVNKIDARFHVKNGLITEHIDSFDFHKWAGQALGFSGKLLGWTSWMKSKVQRSARESLKAFMDNSSAV